MEKSIKDILREQLEIKGISFAKLHQLTGIPERYLIGILEMNPGNIPALPYTRGYLLKIASVLELGGEEFWKKYQHEIELSKSGGNDRLPENRYAITNGKKRWLAALLISLAVIGYAAFNASRILGKPSLTIYSPAEDITQAATATYSLAGKISAQDTLKINDEEVITDPDGSFARLFNLQPGLNTFEFSVKRLLGKEIKVVKQIMYQPTTNK